MGLWSLWNVRSLDPREVKSWFFKWISLNSWLHDERGTKPKFNRVHRVLINWFSVHPLHVCTCPCSWEHTASMQSRQHGGLHSLTTSTYSEHMGQNYTAVADSDLNRFSKWKTQPHDFLQPRPFGTTVFHHPPSQTHQISAAPKGIAGMRIVY